MKRISSLTACALLRPPTYKTTSIKLFIFSALIVWLFIHIPRRAFNSLFCFPLPDSFCLPGGPTADKALPTHHPALLNCSAAPPAAAPGHNITLDRSGYHLSQASNPRALLTNTSPACLRRGDFFLEDL